MTFKQFMKTVAYLPADAFTGVVKLVLGYTDKYGDEHRGLLGLATDGIKFVGRSISDFLSEHKKAITTAAWLTLATAGAVALTLFLWPAALTAVASFSIYGFSIAGIAGANALAQIGLASLLAGAAVSAATYVGAAAGNFFSWVADCCKNIKSKAPKSANEDEYREIDEDEYSDKEDDTLEVVSDRKGIKATEIKATETKTNPLSALSTSTDKKESSGHEHVDVLNFDFPATSKVKGTAPVVTKDEKVEQTNSL
ncbi:hypothetical protein [Legionella sp. PC997]|uniref:hypothetical protein n=1 Tax=Legionella sp. PC997 TaxID=2755562 RepID=UPI0015FAAF04|nr:hypothetical protein [Legionella sp. PC997]QMT58782.1 hypothetical protein HBNCFIEN_00135 [Legionella sp. PC997]